MYAQVEKSKESKSRAVANSVAQKKSNGKQGFGFVDNRPETFAQRKLQAMTDNYSARQQQPIQKKTNNTGLPDNLKSGIENLSGYSMDDVKVHYNSDKPAQLHAHAYAQGIDIHLGSGQEKHLPHEAWHVVQQKQGRVKPTMQLKGNVNINDDSVLEKEADWMGAKAIAVTTQLSSYLSTCLASESTIQRVVLNTSIGPIDTNLEHNKMIGYIEHADVNMLFDLKRQLIIDPEKELSHDEILLKRIIRRINEIQSEQPTNQVGWIIKLELPGSGDTLWRSNKDKIQGQIIPVPGESVMHQRTKPEKTYKTTFTIAGPLGKVAPGAPPEGTSDSGSNSIEKNVSIAYLTVINHIRMIRSTYPYCKDLLILVKIKSHSRNAVAGARIANLLIGSDPKLKVEYVGFDPVPGPDHSGDDVDNDIGSIGESTVIYSMQTEYKKFFTPTRMRNMKRLIISKQLHGGGINHGYIYGGKLYKGSKINELPPGIYYDNNQQDSTANPLLKIDPNQASALFGGQLEPGWFDPQTERKNIVKSALADRAAHDAF